MSFEITLEGGSAHAVDVTRLDARAIVTIDGREHRGSLRRVGDAYELTLADRVEPLWIVLDGDAVHLHAFGRAWTATVVDPVERARAGGPSEDVASAPMPGVVIIVSVAPGDAVVEGQGLVVIESMKMQNEIVAVRDGVVDRVFLEVGETFDRGAGLVSLVPLPADEDED
jgi:acetyl/propionyl-CoA carboxylase alpha subunit